MGTQVDDTTLRITLGQHSRAGRHGVNQDFHGAMLPGGALLHSKGIALALADGIGSSAVSQVASAAAVRGFLEDYYATSDAWSVRRSAQRVLAATNSWLHAQNQRGDARFDKDRGHVCTFSALILKGRELHLLHVGDARIYRVHEAALERLTEDHRVHLGGAESYLGRALGVNAAVEIDYQCLSAEAGAIYLLATDGAYTGLDAAAVQAALARWPGDFDAAAQALADHAQLRGSDDDMTVQLLRVDALPPGDPQQLQSMRESLALPPPLAPRMCFEGYTIVRPLHVSARSHVHLAVDDATGRQVVIKTPSTDLSEDAAHLDGFLLEEWVARRLNSPHVLRPLPDERPRRHLYVAMEYVQGQTLAQWMTDHPRPDLDSVRRIVAQLGAGLAAFHGKEMLHQDLRPENVMIDAAGTVKIIDFAAVRVAGLAEGSPDTAPAIAGSLQYTAPEYFSGGAVGERSDLFSLAVLSYQMLCGQLPYGLQVTQVRNVAGLRRLRYQPLRNLRPDLPAWLDAVLRKALQAEPGRRQEAVSEFVHDLRAPGPQFLRERVPPLAQRHPLFFWQMCTLVLALAVLGLLGRMALVP
ncbi:bifunctional protein-serine/threonine kinase/phosphatase [Variovorax sp. OV329]|uniref:bifunctional protein-serine/threonine kinase/phosphatase n=1 Tax=Variovorax sp. OV329 TaxID=1882825 RepID=UPI0008F1AB73|nr:bifunctional protein-serine/threonine kinase/phosphatase [Variovorax sp. OV329]SFM73296.1 Serine/threonine protein kinase [Variovorax sp. OV329]